MPVNNNHWYHIIGSLLSKESKMGQIRYILFLPWGNFARYPARSSFHWGKILVNNGFNAVECIVWPCITVRALCLAGYHTLWLFEKFTLGPMIYNRKHFSAWSAMRSLSTLARKQIRAIGTICFSPIQQPISFNRMMNNTTNWVESMKQIVVKYLW